VSDNANGVAFATGELLPLPAGRGQGQRTQYQMVPRKPLKPIQLGQTGRARQTIPPTKMMRGSQSARVLLFGGARADSVDRHSSLRQMIPKTMKAPISIRTAAPATADARNSSLGSIGDLRHTRPPTQGFNSPKTETVSVPAGGDNWSRRLGVSSESSRRKRTRKLVRTLETHGVIFRA
jgi:hypothetical protein